MDLSPEGTGGSFRPTERRLVLATKKRAPQGRPANPEAKLQVFIDADLKRDLVDAAQAMDVTLGVMLDGVLRKVRGDEGSSVFCMAYAEQRLDDQKKNAA